MRYAPFLAAAFVLWPLMGFLGGQGFTPLLILAALPALVLSRPGLRPAGYFLVISAFVVWAVASELWSPASKGIISGSLAGGDFAIRSAGLRLAMTAIFATIAIAGTLKIAQGSAQVSSRVVLGAFAVQGLLVAGSILFAEPLLGLFYGDAPIERGEGVQNIARNANAFLLVLPILVAYLGVRPGIGWKLVGLGLTCVFAFLFTRADGQAALTGAGLMLLAMGFVWVLPRYGVRWLFFAAGAYIAAAPILFGGLIYGLGKADLSLPGSFQSRVWSWDVVLGKIREAPLTGHGIAASKTWRETYADHPDWLARLPDFWATFPVVPGHPHNMGLQIWAETGAVGAVLCAIALILAGLRLPLGTNLRPDIRYATAGVLAAALSLFSFSYSVWNEAFWATLALVTCAIILLAKRERGSLA